jgi:hypothetical protein
MGDLTMPIPGYPSSTPTPTQAEINTATVNIMGGSTTRPVYASDGSGAYRALPPWPHPNGHPPGSIYK